MNNVTATWDNEQNKKTLNGINLKVKQGELCAIIGPVGSGKVHNITLTFFFKYIY